MSFDPTAMRVRFHELGKSRDAILARSAPLREQREALVKQAQTLEAQVADLTKQIQPIEEPLFAIDQERAALVRALNGKTGAA